MLVTYKVAARGHQRAMRLRSSTPSLTSDEEDDSSYYGSRESSLPFGDAPFPGPCNISAACQHMRHLSLDNRLFPEAVYIAPSHPAANDGLAHRTTFLDDGYLSMDSDLDDY